MSAGSYRRGLHMDNGTDRGGGNPELIKASSLVFQSMSAGPYRRGVHMGHGLKGRTLN